MASATAEVVQTVYKGPLRIVMGQFQTANNVTNNIDLSQCGPTGSTYDSGVRLSKNSVVLLTFESGGLPAPYGYIATVPLVDGASTFVVNFPVAPASGVTCNFCIIG